MSGTVAWPQRSFVGACVCLLLGVALPRFGSAQQQPGAEADELTQAVLRYVFRYEGGHARLVRGGVPEDLRPQFYAPPGTRVIGTIVTNNGAVVLATTTTPAESLHVLYARELERRGWKVAGSMGRGGFVPSIAGRPITLCREGARLHVAQNPQPDGSSDLYLDYREMPCDETVARVRLGEPGTPLPVPTLYDPPPALGSPMSRCYPRGLPSGRSSMATRTIVLSDLSAEQVLAHYARQLEAAGWRTPTGRSPMSAMDTWVRTDSTGTLEVTLRVNAGGPTNRCYEVEMTVTAGRPNR